jgi:hypothetical protein
MERLLSKLKPGFVVPHQNPSVREPCKEPKKAFAVGFAAEQI